MPFDGKIGADTQILINARARLEKGWSKDRTSKTIDGYGCNARDPSAVSWCLYGAVLAEVEDTGVADAVVRTLIPLLPAEYRRLDLSGIGYFNDDQHSVAPVLEVLDRAIAMRKNNNAI